MFTIKLSKTDWENASNGGTSVRINGKDEILIRQSEDIIVWDGGKERRELFHIEDLGDDVVLWAVNLDETPPKMVDVPLHPDTLQTVEHDNFTAFAEQVDLTTLEAYECLMWGTCQDKPQVKKPVNARPVAIVVQGRRHIIKTFSLLDLFQALQSYMMDADPVFNEHMLETWDEYKTTGTKYERHTTVHVLESPTRQRQQRKRPHARKRPRKQES